jgi:acetyltransferase-like isoleucine patch superfamily enzyme
VKTLLLGLILISPPFLKTWLLRWFCGARIGRGAHIGWFSAVMGSQITMGDHSAVRPLTLIKLAGEIQIGHYSEISSFNLIYGSSSLIVGDNCYIGPQSLLNVDQEVRLGNRSALGPRSMVFTHGSFLPYTEGYWAKLAGVTLGDNVWCAAGVFLHPGTEIGDDSFVNSRSVVSGTIPAGSVAEGNPAQVVYSMDRVKRKMTPRRVDAAIDRVLGDFAEIGLRRELGIAQVIVSKNQLLFHWHGRTYSIALIPSTETPPVPAPPTGRTRHIYLVNRSDWTPPAGALTFDLTGMKTRSVADPVHRELRLFMLRYYGIRFAEQEPGSISEPR